MVGAGVEVALLKVKIYYKGQAVTGTPVDLKVGQLVELAARVDGSEVPSEIQWVIPGMPIKSFTSDPMEGIVQFRIEFSGTKDLAGETCWAQVGESRRARTYNNGTQNSENESGLDGQFPYDTANQIVDSPTTSGVDTLNHPEWQSHIPPH